jgi:hypothetical protein
MTSFKLGFQKKAQLIGKTGKGLGKNLLGSSLYGKSIRNVGRGAIGARPKTFMERQKKRWERHL